MVTVGENKIQKKKNLLSLYAIYRIYGYDKGGEQMRVERCKPHKALLEVV